MPDSKRLPFESADEAVNRDRQIDALLEEGLDRYFHNRYEDAIHLWTRVLFLDRSHPKARAYIDRARTALAEVHRRSEEMLQASRALLDEGRMDDARQLLSEAVATGGDDLQSAALRVELERRERARVLAAPAGGPVDVEPIPGWSWRRTSPFAVALVAAAGLLVLLGGLALIDLTDTDVPATPAGVVSAAPVSVPSSSEVALVRARALFVRGRLSEALVKLDGVAPNSPQRLAADELRIEIQQLLLASVRSSTVSGSPSTEAIRR